MYGAGKAHRDNGVGAQTERVLRRGNDLHRRFVIAQKGNAAVDAKNDALAQKAAGKVFRHADGGQKGVRARRGQLADQRFRVPHGGQHVEIGAVIHGENEGFPVGAENMVHSACCLCHMVAASLSIYRNYICNLLWSFVSPNHIIAVLGCQASRRKNRRR